MTITEIRKQLKGMECKLKIESLSWGKHATITRDGRNMPTIFTKETLANWQEVIEFKKTIGHVTDGINKVYGF